MFVKPRLVQFLTSVSVAAMFIATPLAVKFDGAGEFAVVATAAFAQAIPDDIPGGPIEPPTDCDGVCGPPTDPVDPPTEPVDPPTEPVDPPTDPVDPPTEPVDPPTEPVATPSPSDDDDDEPAPPPVADIPAGGTPKQDGLAFVKTLRCQTACTASVAGDGDVTVTLTSTTQGGDSIETKITQDGTDVATTIVVAEKIVMTAEESFVSEDTARDVIAERTRDVPEIVVLKVDLGLAVIFLEDVVHSKADFEDDFSTALGISETRLKVISVNEG